jgi:hypothetical protein
MNLELEENEKRLILLLLSKATVNLVDTEAVQVSQAAQSLLAKLQPPPQLEVLPPNEGQQESENESEDLLSA